MKHYSDIDKFEALHARIEHLERKLMLVYNPSCSRSFNDWWMLHSKDSTSIEKEQAELIYVAGFMDRGALKCD